MASAYRSCIFFLADGARPDVFEALLKAGKLPNIARYMVEPGSFRVGTTVFPSTTGPAYLPFLTGCFPGPANVPGIRWFDRKEYARTFFSMTRFRSYVGIESALFNRDFRKDFPTLFEICERPVNLFSVVNRGAGRGNLTSFTRMWYVYYAHLTDRWGFVDRVSVEKLLHALDSRPDFVFSVLPAIDEYAHLSEPFSPHTQAAYEEMDRLIGQVVDKLKQQGRLEETLLMISSDHGLSATHTHFGVDRFLENRGIKTFFYPLIFKRNFQAATMVSGNGMCHVYVRGKGSWGDDVTFEDLGHLPVNIPEELVAREEVDFVAGRGAAGGILVSSKQGLSEVKRSNGHFHWRNLRGSALGLTETPPQGLTSEEALKHSFDSDYPDALVQLEQIFQSSRTGDLVVSAKPGFDLRDRFESPEHRGSHGSLHREHMLVPIVSSAKLQEGPLRTVDLYSTMLEALGKSENRFTKHVDGVVRTLERRDNVRS